MKLKTNVCDVPNNEEVSRLLDSGILKAMLDIFNHYIMKSISNNEQARNEDSQMQIQIGQVMISVLQSKMS